MKAPRDDELRDVRPARGQHHVPYNAEIAKNAELLTAVLRDLCDLRV